MVPVAPITNTRLGEDAKLLAVSVASDEGVVAAEVIQSSLLPLKRALAEFGSKFPSSLIL
jgi:hypothetical protein